MAEKDKNKGTKWLSKILEENLEKALRKIFFWEEDPKRIGNFIRFLHISLIYLSVIWYVLIHTFMPSYFLFLLFFIFVFLIWLQHCVCGGCLFSRIEQRLIGDTKSFVDPIMETFHIPITPESTDGVVLLGSTSLVIMLSCELILRTITNIRNYLSN